MALTKVPASMADADVATQAELDAVASAKADDTAVVKLAGDQTVAGVKTFSSQPVLPQKLTQGTAQASTTGTAIDFTGIPTWAKRITVAFSGVSLSATANLLAQIGPSGGFETTGYASGSSYAGSTADGSAANSTTGFIIRDGVAAGLISGLLTLVNVSGNTWVASFHGSRTDSASIIVAGGTKTLAGVLDRIRITSTSTDTFDAGSINILYE